MSSKTASGFSPLSQHEAKRRARCDERAPTASKKDDPMPSGRDYGDPIVFARDYEAWLNRHGQTMAPGEKPKLNPKPAQARPNPHLRANFDGVGEGENR